jgi:hypothetical protein
MRNIAIMAMMLALPAAAQAEEPLRATYRTYALGTPVAEVEASIGLGPWSYQLALSYRTTGLARLVAAGQTASAVYGTWDNDRPSPHHFEAQGMWHQEQRATLIDYRAGIPTIRRLLPPLDPEMEQVAPDLRTNSTDILSAVGALIRTVQRSGRCEGIMRTYDGRRAADIAATTGGMETLEPTDRSSFAGQALRCAFVSHVLAGFRAEYADRTDYRPLHGSAWIAVAVPNRPPIPVRISLETRWFGDVTSYLTSVSR